MCHLCRKLEEVKELDSKAIKPISALLSRLHKKIEPQLGDLWLERHDQIVNVRTLLAKLYEVMPVKPLLSILNHVERELRHIQKNMPNHPPHLSIGRLSTLKESIAPSSSASYEVIKHTHRQDAQKRGSSRGVRRQMSGSRRKRVVSPRRTIPKDTVNENELPELPGSDLDPPLERMQHSTRIVEDWFERCDEVRDNKWVSSGQLVHPATAIPATIDRSKGIRARDQEMYIRTWAQQ